MPRPEDITLSVIQTLSIMQESRFNEITTAESTRWRSAVMPIWATEARFSPSKQQFSRIHAVSACVWRRINLRLCTQPSECRRASRPKGTFLPPRQSGMPGSRPFLRGPVRCWPWADYCGDWPASLFGKSGKALWHVLRRSKKAKSEGETALRASRCGPRARIESVFSSPSGQFQIEETRARSV